MQPTGVGNVERFSASHFLRSAAIGAIVAISTIALILIVYFAFGNRPSVGAFQMGFNLGMFVLFIIVPAGLSSGGSYIYQCWKNGDRLALIKGVAIGVVVGAVYEIIVVTVVGPQLSKVLHTTNSYVFPALRAALIGAGLALVFMVWGLFKQGDAS